MSKLNEVKSQDKYKGKVTSIIELNSGTELVADSEDITELNNYIRIKDKVDSNVFVDYPYDTITKIIRVIRTHEE